MSQAIYLDNNATTPLDPRGIDAMTEVYRTHFGNASSSSHPYGWYAAELVEIAREDVAALIGASPEEIVFTSGATEANNLALLGVARAAGSNERPELLSVVSEHDAVLDPLAALMCEGFRTTFLPIQTEGNAAGLVSEETFAHEVGEQTLLASVMLANNEIGVLQDVRALAKLAHNHGALFHTDATQAVGKIPVSVDELDVDLLSCTAHKMYGPKGVGALYIRRGKRRPNLTPLVFGGGHEKGLRSGTLNVPGIVGFGVACRIAREQVADDVQRIESLASELLTALQNSVEGVTLNGCRAPRLPGNLNLLIAGIDTTRLLGLTNTKLAYSTTAACQSDSVSPSHVLAALGLSVAEQRSSIRLGIGRFNTKSDIEQATQILSEAIYKLRS